MKGCENRMQTSGKRMAEAKNQIMGLLQGGLIAYASVMFSRGRGVIYRELWASRNESTSTLRTSSRITLGKISGRFLTEFAVVYGAGDDEVR